MDGEDISPLIMQGIREAESTGKVPAFAYLRVSTDKQEERGLSLDDQEHQCAQYAARSGLHLVHIFRKAESARKKDRKVFNQMLRAAEAWHVTHLVMRSSDRMSRNTPDYAKMEELIDYSGYHVHFFHSNKVINKASPGTDRMILGIEIAINKGRSDEISQYSKSMHKYRADRGVAPCPSPLGYKYNGKEHRHELDPENEKMMRYIFDAFDGGKYTIGELANHLVAMGYTAPRGKPWYWQALQRILTSRFYHGEFLYHNEVRQGIHEPYYTIDRFEKRMKRFGSDRPAIRRNKREFAFGGLLKCSCGLSIYGDVKEGGHKSGVYTYYVHKCRDTGRQRVLPEDRLIDMFDIVMNNLVLSREYCDDLTAAFRAILSDRRSSATHDKAQFARRINQLRAKIDKLYDLYSFGGFEVADLRDQVTKVHAQIRELESRKLEVIENMDEVMLKVAATIESLYNLPRVYAESSREKKALIIKASINRITFNGEEIAIDWKAPLGVLLKDSKLHEGFEKLRLWVDDGARTRNHWSHSPGLCH